MDGIEYGDDQTYGVTKAAVTYGDAQTRGQLRHWKKKLAERYATFNDAYTAENKRRASSLSVDMVKGTGATRRRAFDKLTAMFGPGLTLESSLLKRNASLVVWSILKPRSAVITHAPDDLSHAAKASLAQDCVTVNYVIAGVHKDRVILAEGLWTLEVPDHALGRAVERSRFLTPEAIIREAHTTLLNLPTASLTENHYLRAGPGCFAGKVTVARDVNVGPAIHVRALTWLDNDILRPDQIPLGGVGAEGDRLKDLLFLPAPLRS